MDDIYKRYNTQNVIYFYKADDQYGILSNMKGRLFLHISDIVFTSTEVLYQSLRYPHLPNLQKIILIEKSPLSAKRKSYQYIEKTREDWDYAKNNIMRLCLRLKILQCDAFKEKLLSTIGKEIVEISRKDQYWGAIKENEFLIGQNVLGRLLMELREEFIADKVVERLRYIIQKENKLTLLGKKIELEDIILFNKQLK